ncbi:MAG: hypothetical protein ACI9ES_002968 [Oceanospirillaceae bacterium]|jgi:hypothetical protein
MFQVLLFVITYISGLVLPFRYAPVFAFVAYQAVYFFRPENRYWHYMVPDISYSFISVVVMLLVVIFNFPKLKSNMIYKAPIFKWFFALLCLVWFAKTQATVTWAHDEAVGLYTNLFITMCLAYALIDTRKHLDYVLWGYIYGSWYISFVVYQMGRNTQDRVEGIGPVDANESNGLAAAIAPSVVLAFYYFWISRSKIAKGMFAIAMVFIANAIVLINSRGAFLAVAVSMSFFMWHMFFSKFQRPKQKLTVIWFGVLGFCALIYIADDSFVSRMKTMVGYETSKEEESGGTRLFYWKGAIQMSFDYPLGLGTRGFDSVAPLYIPQDVNTGNTRNRSVHSTWFEVLTELGYMGLFCFISMILCCLSGLKKVRKKLYQEGAFEDYFKMYAIQASLISFMLSMTFINRYRAEILYWLVLFSAAAYNIYILKDDKKVVKNET